MRSKGLTSSLGHHWVQVETFAGDHLVLGLGPGEVQQELQCQEHRNPDISFGTSAVRPGL